MKELLCGWLYSINSIQQIPQLEMIHYTEHTDSVRRPDVLQRSRLNNKKVIIVITTDQDTLTVTLPCFTASFRDLCDLVSGTGGNFTLWTSYWGQYNLPTDTSLMVAVLCPCLTASPAFIFLEVYTFTHW